MARWGIDESRVVRTRSVDGSRRRSSGVDGAAAHSRAEHAAGVVHLIEAGELAALSCGSPHEASHRRCTLVEHGTRYLSSIESLMAAVRSRPSRSGDSCTNHATAHVTHAGSPARHTHDVADSGHPLAAAVMAYRNVPLSNGISCVLSWSRRGSS